MKNKEIIKRLRDSLDYEFDLSFNERKELLSYIEQLEKENDRLKEVVENLTTMTVNGDTKQIKNTAQYKLEQLENNRDKAYEFVKEKRKVFEWYDTDLFYLESLLKGDSHE